METDPGVVLGFAVRLGCHVKRRTISKVGPVGVGKVLLAEKAATGQKLWIGYLFPGAVYSGTNFGDVGKLVTPVDCKSAARKALLVQLQSSPPSL